MSVNRRWLITPTMDILTNASLIRVNSMILDIPLLRSDFSRHSLTILLGTCGTAHVCSHLPAVMSSIQTRAHILFEAVLNTSSAPDFVGFPRRTAREG